MTKILLVETKTDKNSNPMKVCQLEGGKTVYVNSKYDSEIYPLVDVDKEVELIQEGNFWKIDPASLGVTAKKFYKGGNIKEAQERKETSIKDAQNRTAESIKMASSARDATQILIAYPELLTNPELKEKIQKEWMTWRKWFYEQYNMPFV